jgi:hypothetical protein
MTAESAAVRIGASTVRLRERPRTSKIHPVGFTIPAKPIVQAKQWPSNRVPLLTKNSADEFPRLGLAEHMVSSG